MLDNRPFIEVLIVNFSVAREHLRTKNIAENTVFKTFIYYMQLIVYTNPESSRQIDRYLYLHLICTYSLIEGRILVLMISLVLPVLSAS